MAQKVAMWAMRLFFHHIIMRHYLLVAGASVFAVLRLEGLRDRFDPSQDATTGRPGSDQLLSPGDHHADGGDQNDERHDPGGDETD
jgi:hypothetical protein